MATIPFKRVSTPLGAPIGTAPAAVARQDNDGTPRINTDTGRAGRIGMWALAIGFGGFLLCATLAPLDEGVAARGVVAVERELQSLVMRVTQAHLETLLAEEQLRLVVLQKSTYATQVDAAHKGFTAGSGTPTDMDEAQARLDLTVATNWRRARTGTWPAVSSRC